MLKTEFMDNSGQLFLRFKAISKNKYARIALNFCLLQGVKEARSELRNYFYSEVVGKKTSKLGIFFAGNRLREMASHAET